MKSRLKESADTLTSPIGARGGFKRGKQDSSVSVNTVQTVVKLHAY